MSVAAIETTITRILNNEERAREISLAARQINDDTIRQVADALKGNNTLTVLDIQGNSIGPNGAAYLADALRINQTITEINFENNKIGDEGAQYLDEALNVNNSVISLHVELNGISSKLLESIHVKCMLNTQPLALKRALPRILANDPLLKELDLSEYAGANISTQMLSDALKYNSTLLVLNLNGMNIGDKGCETLAGMLRRNNTLTELNLAHNGIGLHGLRDMAEALKENGSLTSLHMENNKVGDEGSRVFIDILRSNDALTYVNLKQNAISAIALQSLQSAVALNSQPLALKKVLFQTTANDKTLTEIDFSEHPNMEQSAVLLASALKTNTFVTALNLSNAGIGDEGAKAIASVLLQNRSIAQLGLANNNISLYGGRAIAESLLENQVVVDINLANNHIGEGAAVFINSLVVNNSLVALNLELNDVADAHLEEIEDALFLNQQPVGLKKLLPSIYDNTETLRTIDFSTYDGCRFHNDSSAKLLARALKHNNTVTHLNLSNNNVGDAGMTALADVLKYNKNIKVVELSANSVGDKGCLALCDALRVNNTLTRLDLEHNNVTEKGAQALLDVLKTNHVLTQLLIKSNKITQHLQADLQIACAINTQPVTLKKAVPRLRNNDNSFVMLDVSAYEGAKGGYDDTAVTILCHEMQGNDTLAVVNLSNNKFEADGAKAIADWLTTNTACQELHLAEAHIGDLGCRFIAEALKKNTGLQRLNLENNGIGDRGAEALIDMLSTNDSLTWLKMDRNDIAKSLLHELSDAVLKNSQPIALKRLLKHVGDNDPSVTTLDFSEYDGERYCDDTSCRMLAVVLKDNDHVTSLNLANNKITHRGAQYLADALEENKALLELNLNSNVIGDKGAQAFIAALGPNNTMEKLWAENNNISDDIMQQLNYALMINNQPLTLKGCIDALQSNSTDVVALDFSPDDWKGRVIDDEACMLLCQAMLTNDTLTSLDLGNNRIGPQGAACIADLLRTNTTIERLDLRNNPLGQKGGNAIAQALKFNHTLGWLNMDGTGIDDEALEAITGAINVNAQPISGRKGLRMVPTDLDSTEDDFHRIEYYGQVEQTVLEDAMVDQVLLIK